MFYFANLSVKCLFQALSRHIVILSIGRFAVTQIAVLGGNIIIFPIRWKWSTDVLAIDMKFM